MLVAAAVCPHPPLLLPDVAQQRAVELDALRQACQQAVEEMLAVRPEVVICAGAGPRLRTFDESHAGSLRPFGVGVRTGGEGPADLPLSQAVGAWLLDRAGWAGPRRYVSLPQETTADSCAEMGATVAGADLRIAVLAMGDGSAKRSTDAPGYLDERAAAFDADVVGALGRPDPRWLVEQIAPLACAELWVGGRPAWQFLAGAASQTPWGSTVAARVLYDAAPYGVGYVVAGWSVTDAADRRTD